MINRNSISGGLIRRTLLGAGVAVILAITGCEGLDNVDDNVVQGAAIESTAPFYQDPRLGAVAGTMGHAMREYGNARSTGQGANTNTVRSIPPRTAEDVETAARGRKHYPQYRTLEDVEIDARTIESLSPRCIIK